MHDDAQNKKALEDIEKYGCHIINVLANETGPSFSYSIGIEKTLNQPELLVVGLKQELSQWIINDYYRRLKSGEKLLKDTLYSGFIEKFDVQFRQVSKMHYEDYFGWGLWLYEGPNFRTNQLIWPSTDGHWPWDINAPDNYKYQHPMLTDT